MAGKRDNYDDLDFEVMDLSDPSHGAPDAMTEEHAQSRQVLSNLHSTARTQEQRAYQGEHYVSREPLGSAPRPSYKSNATPRSLSNGTGAPTPQSMARERLSQTQSISMKQIQERLSQTQSISAHEIQERLSMTQALSAQEIQSRLEEDRGLSENDRKRRSEQRRKEIQKQQKKNKRRTGYVEVHEESMGVELNEGKHGLFGWKKTNAKKAEAPNNRPADFTASMSQDDLGATGRVSQASRVAAAKAAEIRRAATAGAAAGAEAVSRAAQGRSTTAGYGQGGLMQRHHDNRFDRDVRRGLNESADTQRQRQMVEQINADMLAQMTGRITDEVIEESRGQMPEGPQVIGMNPQRPRPQGQPGVSSATGVIGQRQPGVSSATGVIGQRQPGVSSATGVIGQRQPGVSSATGVIGQRQPGVSSATGVIGQRPVNNAPGAMGQRQQRPQGSNGQHQQRPQGANGQMRYSGNNGQPPQKSNSKGRKPKDDKKKSKYKKGLIIQFSIIGGVLIAALILLWLFLASYQKSLPEHTMDAAITSIAEGNMAALKLTDDSGNPLDETAQNAIGEAIKAISDGKELDYKKVSSESDSEKQSYYIYTADDGNLLKTVLARSDEKMGFGLRGWNISATTVVTDKVTARTLTVTIPSGSTLLVNGNPADTSLRTAEAQEIPILQRCIGAGIVSGMPKVDIYTLTNIYVEPDLKVMKEDGTTEPCVKSDENAYEGGFAASQEFYDANAPRVMEIFYPYAKYFSGDINFYQLMNYVVTGSPAANQAQATDVSWMQEHTSVDLTDLSVTNMRRYTDDCFACDISFVETIYQGDYAAKTWNTNMTWVLVRQNGTFYLADFVNR